MVNKNPSALFPEFQTREDFALTFGLEAPEPDYTKPFKHWVDPDPKVNDEGEVEHIVFKRGPDGRVAVDVTTGLPKFKKLRLSPEDAKEVNIPVKKFPAIDKPNVHGNLDVPVRPLKEGEKWKIQLFGDPIIVQVGDGSGGSGNQPVQNLSEVLVKLEDLQTSVDRLYVLLAGR